MKAGDKVTLHTIGGPQPGIMIDPVPTRADNVRIRKVYIRDGVTSYGHVQPFNAGDVTPGWPASVERKKR